MRGKHIILMGEENLASRTLVPSFGYFGTTLTI
jgi:hypothetical protein